MFKPHIGICACHNKQRMIVVKKGYCKQGNEEKKRGSGLKKTIKAPKQRKKTGERELFREIWAERPHISVVSGQVLKGFHIWCFSHILPKGTYPGYRLKKENIVLKTIMEHYDWTNNRHKLKDLPEWQSIFELEQKLKEKYNKENSKTPFKRNIYAY